MVFFLTPTSFPDFGDFGPCKGGKWIPNAKAGSTKLGRTPRGSCNRTLLRGVL